MKKLSTTLVALLILAFAGQGFAQAPPARNTPPVVPNPAAAATGTVPGTGAPATTSTTKVVSIAPSVLVSSDKDVPRAITIKGSGLEGKTEIKFSDANGDLPLTVVDAGNDRAVLVSVKLDANASGQYDLYIDGNMVEKIKLVIKDKATVEREQAAAAARAAAQKVNQMASDVNNLKLNQQALAERVNNLPAAPTQDQINTMVNTAMNAKLAEVNAAITQVREVQVGTLEHLKQNEAVIGATVNNLNTLTEVAQPKKGKDNKEKLRQLFEETKKQLDDWRRTHPNEK